MLRAPRAALLLVVVPCAALRGLTQAQGGAPPSFAHWASARVDNQPAAVPALQGFPACTVHPATGACLPQFQVIGVQKAGTSTLWQILSRHPQITPAYAKELLFFHGPFGRNAKCVPPETAPSDQEFTDQYLRRFPAVRPGAYTITGEFSATYLHCGCCPQSMKRLMPSLRVVVQLRDPIERARSRWTEQTVLHRVGPLYDTFEEYVDNALPALESCLQEAGGWLKYEVHCTENDSILGLSLYDSPIALWLKHFDPGALLVTYLDQLASSPQSVATAIHRHLGVDDVQYPEDLLDRRWNAQGAYGWDRAQPKVKHSGSMERLFQFYRPHVQALKTKADAGLISPLPASWVERWGL